MRIRPLVAGLAATLTLGILGSSPALARTSAPASLTVTAFVVDQQCQGGDFVKVTLSATADSSSEVRGFRWDFTNNGSFDTRANPNPTVSHNYADEITVTARVGARNVERDTAFDTVTFATLRCP